MRNKKLVFVGTPLIAALIGYSANLFLLQQPMNDVLKQNAAFRGMKVSAHYEYWVVPGVVVYDLADAQRAPDADRRPHGVPRVREEAAGEALLARRPLVPRHDEVLHRRRRRSSASARSTPSTTSTSCSTQFPQLFHTDHGKPIRARPTATRSSSSTASGTARTA